MSRTIKTTIADPHVAAWIDAHDICAPEFSDTITVNDDGTVVMRKFRLNEQGRRYVLPGTNVVAVDEVLIDPRFPFPI